MPETVEIKSQMGGVRKYQEPTELEFQGKNIIYQAAHDRVFGDSAYVIGISEFPIEQNNGSFKATVTPVSFDDKKDVSETICKATGIRPENVIFEKPLYAHKSNN